MKFDHGAWAGWEVWVEYSDGTRLEEHNISLHGPTRGDRRQQADVQLECQHGKDFAIIVAPPATNQLEFKVSARADGGNVRGKTMRGAGKPAVRKIARLDDQYSQTEEGLVLKTLQFSQLGTLEDAPDQDVSTELGQICVTIRAGVLRSKNEGGGGTIRGRAATSAVDEKRKKISLTSYVDGRVIRAVDPHLRPGGRSDTIHSDRNMPPCRVTFKYATLESILTQNSSAEDRRAQNRERSATLNRTPERKPKLRRSRSSSEAETVEGSRRKRAKRESAVQDSPEPLFIDVLPDPAVVIDLLDSDSDDDWPIALEIDDLLVA